MELTLIEFISSLLPAALIAKVGVFVPVVVAVIGLILKCVPRAKARKRWLAPLLALLLGLAAGFVAVGMDTSQWPLALGTGLLIALTAIGGHSTGKNVSQAVKSKQKKAPSDDRKMKPTG